MTETGPIPVREGDLVAGKYRVEAVIGAGGMGIVVSARHEQLDQRVAIKFVRGETLANDQGVQRFLREARAAARLKSEHAAKVLDVGTLENGVPYMVMELLEGSDLGQRLAERGPLPVEIAAEWIAQACEAIAEAHAAGIVHRDLKPQNLFLARMVGGVEKVKVLDFGVAKSIETLTSGLGALTRTRSMLGSPLYMAPEQMRSSRDVDARVDVWALGVVLFELLTQRWPFEAETMPELCLKVVSDPPQSLFELRPDLPGSILEVVARCLEKDRTRRFANAAELASALEPMVPQRSRIVVERARMALASTPPTTPSPGSRVPVERRAAQGRASGPPPPTPAAWGSGKKSGTASKKRASVLWIGGAVLVTAATVGAVLLAPGRPGGAPLPTRASPMPALGAGPGSESGQQQAAALPLVTLAPPGEVLPPTPSARPAAPLGAAAIGAASAAPAAPVRSGAAPAVAVPQLSAVPQPAVAPARPEPGAKAPTRDDDIPALR